MTRPVRIAAVAVVLVAAAVASLSLLRGRTGSSPDVKATLRLKWVYSAGFAGPIMGKEKGFFKKRGLDLTINPGGPQLDPIKLVAAGTDQFGITGADRLLLARQEGFPVVAIGLDNRYSFVVFTTLAKSGIRKPKDFEGRTVGIQQDDTFTVYQAMVKAAGVDRRRVKEVTVGFDLAPLLEGKVDVYPSYVINQPVILRSQGIAIEVINPRDYGVDFMGNVYFTSEAYLRANPKAVEAFVYGLAEGLQYTISNPREAVDVAVAKDPSLKRADELALLNALIPQINVAGRRLLWMERADWERTQAIMLDQGLLKRPIDLDRAFEARFVRAFYQRN